MRVSRKKVFIFLYIGAGCILLMIPSMGSRLGRAAQNRVIQAHTEAVMTQDQKATEEAWKAAQAYNTRIAGGVPPAVSQADYQAFLNVEGNGVMGYLEIPALGLRVPIGHGLSEKVLRKGAGHMENTALPVGSMGCHTVLAGHNGLVESEIFTHLDQLKTKDVFYIFVLGHRLAYRVDQVAVVEGDAAWKPETAADKSYTTLVTCVPRGINSHRLLVRGALLPSGADTQMDEGAGNVRGFDARYMFLILAGIAVLVGCRRFSRLKG